MDAARAGTWLPAVQGRQRKNKDQGRLQPLPEKTQHRGNIRKQRNLVGHPFTRTDKGKEMEKTHAGSEPINPLETPIQQEEVEVKEPVKETPKEDPLQVLESRLKEKESMIGKQGNAIGSLKKELEALRADIQVKSAVAQGPSDDEQLQEIYRKMDTGEIEIAAGMSQALAINSNLTAQKVISQLSRQQQQGKIAEVQGRFLKDNPDYQEILDSGQLAPYMEADPLSDEYTAFHKFKADEKVAALQKEYEAKILAAKEEGARLAKGSDAAGKVLGKQGSTAMAPQVNRPFANRQEAVDAMTERLKQLRSTS
jgi:predicted RNA-binding protein YlqC (UPF0109 family)